MPSAPQADVATQLKSSGSECRPKTNECDLPEICSGADTECPVDLHIYDGTSCGAEKACANGICSRQLTRALRTCPVNCTDNGVCNNLGKCHCFSGLPPLCQYEAVTSRASLYYLFFLLLVPIIIGVLLFLWSKRRIEIEPQKPPPITVEKRFRNSIGEWAKKRSNLTLSIRPAPSIGNMALLSSGSTPNSARTPLSAATTITQVSPEDGITNPALELGEDRVTFGQRLAVPKVRFCVPSRPAPPPPSLDSRLQHSNGVECSPESPGVAKYQTASNGMANGSPLRPAWKKPNQLQENSPPPPPPPPPPAFMKPKL